MDELYNKLKESNFLTFDINSLSRNEIISQKTIEYILTIEDDFELQRTIMEIEDKAKKEGCLTNFRTLLKKYCIKTNNKNQKYTHNEVAEILLEEEFFYLYDNELYIYKDGVYIENMEEIEKKILNKYPESTSKFRQEVYQYLKLKAREASINRENGIINFKNGLFNIKTKAFMEHTPDIFLINQINANYKENIKAVQAVDNFLNRISSNDVKRKQTILEMIGYSMTTSVKLQKAFILYGETARNGKSTLINVIIELIGRNNIGNVSFRDMNRNRFSTSGIKGKLLNIGSEMTDDFIDDVSNFKMFITGDFLEIEKKFKDRHTILPYAKFIFNANVLPQVSDKTNGFYRRLHIIPLTTSFTDNDAKNFNYNEVIAEESLEYLAKISLNAYLAMDNQFSNYEESKIEVNKYKINSNSVLSFLNDRETIHSLCSKSKSHTAQSVFTSYKEFCLENQYKNLGRNKFYDEIESTGKVLIGEKNNQKEYTFNM